MDIKVGDIVKYQGKTVRVMEKVTMESTSNIQLRLSCFGWGCGISLDDVELVESIDLPTIKDGDEVIIKPIPFGEQNYYGVGWGPTMDGFVSDNHDTTHKITDISYVDRYGWIGTINHYTFHLYHIEPANSFDMV